MFDASNRDYKDDLVEALRMFRCCKDIDVQNFLNDKAIEFEKRGWTTTYLLLNQERFDEGELKVEGYFSLTHKAVVFDEEVSGSTKNKLAGRKNARCESFVLIGQLGKYIESRDDGSIVTSDITSRDLLCDALGVISQASNYIISRNVIIECKPTEKIQRIYADFGFSELQFDGKLHTMFLKLEHNIDF